MSSGQPAEIFSHREIQIVVVATMLAIFMMFLDQTIVSPALPHIAADLKSDASLSWIVAGYLLAATAVAPIYGKLSDFYGRRLTLQVALTIFLLTSILCALAQSLPMLILARILQGVGGGGLLSTAHAAIADVVSLRDRGKYQGYLSTNAVVSTALGPVLGGFFAEHLTWRWIFWINIPLALFVIVVLQLALAKLTVKRVKHKIDYLGAVLVVSALAAILLVTTLGGAELAWDSSRLLGIALAACVLVTLAVIWEFRVPEAMLPPRLFRSPIFACSVSGAGLMSMCLVGMSVYLPIYLELDHGMRADRVGLAILPLAIGMGVGSAYAGWKVAQLQRYRIFPLVGAAMVSVAMIVLAWTDHATPLVLAVAAMGVFSLGIGLTQPSALVASQNAIDPYDLGAGTAVHNCMRSMCASLGVTLFGSILITRLNAVLGQNGIGVPDAMSLIHAGPRALASVVPDKQAAVLAAIDQAFSDVFLAGLGVGLLGLVVFILLRDVPLRTVAGQAARNAMEQMAAGLDTGGD